MSRTVLALALAVAAVLLAVAAALAPAQTIEAWYARGLYPSLSRTLVPLTSALPFPVAVVGKAGALVLFIFGLVRALVRRRGLGRRLLEALMGLALITIWFYLAWGLNYGRLPASQLLALPAAEPTVERWSDLATALARVVTDHADAEPDVAGAVTALARSLEQLTREISGVRVTLPDRIRRLPAGSLLASGFSGVVSPFTLEAHVDGGLPEAARVAVAAHELAHLAGFAGEADADLLAAVAGLQAPHAYARYATALYAWSRVTAGLSEEARSEQLEKLPQRSRDDLARSREVAVGFRRDGLATWVTALYDRYLRSQRVSAGVGDYDLGAGLLLRAHMAGRLVVSETDGTGGQTQ